MPLDEKSRQEKEAYAQKIMAEMKLKNEKLKERHREVQRDQEKAEERNSSITTGRNSKKEADKDIAPRAKYEREWDRGKPNPDSVDWDSSEHHDYYSRNTRSFSDRRNRKDDSWRSRSTNSSRKPTSSFFSKYHANKNETIPESSAYCNDTNRSRSLYNSSNPIKGCPTPESNHPYQNPKMRDHSKKSSEERISASVNYSESKKESPVDKDNSLDELMWQCGGLNEVQHKMSRIENWVKSININQGFTETNDTINKNEDYKTQVKHKEVGPHHERTRKYGSVEDSSTNKSEEQTHLRMKEKSEHKLKPSFSNSRERGNEMCTGDRCSSISNSKNPRDVKRKNLSERCRRKCESDMSDRASSMKESDDFDWGKDQIIQARSNPKSSENACGRGRGKRIGISRKKSMEPSDSCRFENLESNELTKSETDAWNEEKYKETANKQSNLKQNFLQDNQHKYGSKSLPLYDSSENCEFKSHSNQRSSWKRANNSMTNNKFQKNKSESGFISSCGDIKFEKMLIDSPNPSPKFTSDQSNVEGNDAELEKKYNEPKLTTDSHFVSETLQNSDSGCQIRDNWNDCDLKKQSEDYGTVSISRDNQFMDVEHEDDLRYDSHSSESQIISSSVFENSLLGNMNCPKFTSDQSNVEGTNPELKKKYELTTDPHFVSETLQNSDSNYQITDNWNDHDLKKHSEDYGTVSISRDNLSTDEEHEDFKRFDSHSSENQILSSVFENSFLGDMNCSDIYKKNMESAENIIISLQCKQQHDFQVPHRRTVSVKRYPHKKTLTKTVKFPQKSKLFVGGMKVADESLEKSINSKIRNKVSFSNSDHDSSLNVSLSDQNACEPDAKPVSKRKLIETEIRKLGDETDIRTQNLSDDEWTTVTDED